MPGAQSHSQISSADEVGPIPSSLDAIDALNFGPREANHLLLRAGFGGTPRQIETLAEWGPERAVDHLLNLDGITYDPPEPDAFDKNIMRPNTPAEQNEYQRARRQRDEDALARFRAERQNRQRADRRQMGDIQRWWLTRMIETPKPLEEKMTLFWHGLLATSYRTIENSYHMFQQNQLYRTHAVGSYADLLRAIIRDPAMLAYLDNNDSSKRRPNENLARELMELFSLGVGAYTERDIKEGARALTGYTFEDDRFVFKADNHDDGPKSILSLRGKLDGDGFVSAILAQPACARYIAARLYDFFARHITDGSTPIDRDLDRFLDRLAHSLRKSNYEVKPVLRELFLSRHFYHPDVMRQRIKSPAELVVGAVRTLLTPVRDLGVLAQGMELMGQSLFHPPSVKGWDGGRTWINTSTLFVRQNLLNYMLTGALPNGYDAASSRDAYDPTPLIDGLKRDDPNAAANPEAVARSLLGFTVGAEPDAAVTALRHFASEHGSRVNDKTITGMLVLVTAMPEYQLC